MNTKLSKLRRTAIFLAGIFAASIPTIAQANWSFVELGSFGVSDSYYSYAYGINDSGQMVGFEYVYVPSDSAYEPHAFITGPNGIGLTDLGTLSGSSTYPTGINDTGQVIGYSTDGDDVTNAFITGPNGIGMTKLGNLGAQNSLASAINDSGQVVGVSLLPNTVGVYISHAFITGPNGVGMTDLGALYNGLYTNSHATAINDSGQVVGVSKVANTATFLGGEHAFITGTGGVGMIDLGTLGGGMSEASDINDSGQVVGRSLMANNLEYHAFITGSDGVGMTDLGTLGGSESFAVAINDSGEVIGHARTANNSEEHQFIFSHGGITDLDLLAPVVAAGWKDLVVTDINNNGQIVGYGTDSAFHTRSFLLSYTPDTVFDPKPIFIPTPLTSVPEPETYAMLLVGLSLVGFMSRRRIVFQWLINA